MPVQVNGGIEYEAEEILDSRLIKRHGYYLVHWKGYPISEATWEPYENLENSQELINLFHQQFPGKPGPWSIKIARRSTQERGNCQDLASNYQGTPTLTHATTLACLHLWNVLEHSITATGV